MGDTMREAFEAFHFNRKCKGAVGRKRMAARLPDGTYVDDSVQRHWWTWQNAVEAGRQLGVDQARREQAQWQQPGPVTPEHPLECLIVLQSLRQSDGDWWIAGSKFLPEYQPIAWSPDTPEAREALGLPAEPADDDTGAPT